MCYVPRHKKLNTRIIVPDPFYEESYFDEPVNSFLIEKIKGRMGNLSDQDREYLKIRFKGDTQRLRKYIQIVNGETTRLSLADMIAFPFVNDIGVAHMIENDDYEYLDH